jgi:microcystin-dependent protein
MAQSDLNTANAAGAAFRVDLNNHLAALATTSSGTSAPGTTFANQLWVDTTGGASYLKIRNADDDAWITLLQLNQTGDVAECHTNLVDTNSIQNDAVTLAKIAGAAVDATALASNAVTSVKITDANVTTAKIADGAVTSAKLASGLTTITGEIRMWPTAAAPSGWLFCAGAAVSRSTYSALFAVISTIYGVGDGSTTFHLPNFAGRSPVGVGTSSATGATAWALAELGGAETHVLTTAESPAHAHTLLADATAGSSYPTAVNYIAKKGDWGSNNNYQGSGTATTPSLGLSSSSGGGAAHVNMSPVLGINFIIKT